MTLDALDGFVKSFIGEVPGSVGLVAVDGTRSTSTLTLEGLAIGISGQGTLRVTNGGIVNSTYGTVGFADSIGEATVDGANSTWTTLTLNVGLYGQGTLNVRNDGHVQVPGDEAGMGVFSDSMAAATVESGGLFETTTTSLAVGGTVNPDGSGGSAGGTGTLTINSDGNVTVARNLKLWDAGTVHLNAGGLLVADTIERVNNANFNTQAGSKVFVNNLVGFDNFTFNGSLTLGQSSSALATSSSHAVGAGQPLHVRV